MRGRYEQGVVAFKGIPYAAPPVGQRRFATTGDPGWVPYNTQQRPVMRINTTWETVTDPRPLERQAWDGVR